MLDIIENHIYQNTDKNPSGRYNLFYILLDINKDDGQLSLNHKITRT